MKDAPGAVTRVTVPVVTGCNHFLINFQAHRKACNS